MAAVTNLIVPQSRPPAHPLRILLSAYACEPERGSEPGIGWQWATRLAACGHQVHVITRANNQDAIARAMAEHPSPNLHFEFFDLPRWASFWKRGGRGVQLYYFLWQWATFPTAWRLHRRLHFDIVHHLTFGVFRQPSSLAFLKAPFVFGPVGGGESAPRALRKGLPFAARLRELARDAANAYARIDPLMRSVFKRADKILVKTEETRACVPTKYQDHCEVFLEVGIDQRRAAPLAAQDSVAPVSIGAQTAANHPSAPRRGLRVLYVGRLSYEKGLHLALPAFAALVADFPDSRFTIVGSGPREKQLRQLVSQLGIDRHVDWISWLPRDQAMATYPRHDVFLFPSLHDSSGNAVLEAMSCGLPVICLKRGGPANIVDAFSGLRVSADSTPGAVGELSAALNLLARNPALRTHLARGAHTRAGNYFSWRIQIERMNAVYDSLRTKPRPGST